MAETSQRPLPDAEIDGVEVSLRPPKLLACGDSIGNIARLYQTFSELLHFDGHQ
jgi:hypothetical protein